MRPAKSACVSAATVSPPPATLKQSVRDATICATSRVPRSYGAISKTPIGPFQKTVLADCRTSRNRVIVRGPTSTPSRSSGTSAPAVVSEAAPAASASATT